MKRLYSVLVTATLLSFGNSGTRLAAQTDAALAQHAPSLVQPGPARTFMLIAKGDSADMPRLTAIVVNDNREWQALVPMLSDRTDAAIRKPPVDFSLQTIIAVFQGRRGEGGLGIEIHEIIEHPSHIVLSTAELVMQPNCTRAPKRSPYEIIAVPKTNKRVEIDTFMELVACDYPE
jgi:hypothetical protein